MPKLFAEIQVGDSVERLKNMSPKSVRTCVTSPPYWGLRDYGNDGQLGLEGSPQEFVENLCKVFDEVWRVLADDGTCWVNLGDSYYSPTATQGRNEGKSAGNISSTKSLIAQGHKTYKRNVSGLKAKDLVGIPWRFAFAMQDRGWYLRQDIIWAKPNPMPESVRDRCTKSHEYIFLFSKSPKYFFDTDAIKENASSNGFETRNKRSVWNVSVARFKGAHFATFPPALIEPCVLAGSAENDIVLDPFSGSGTTGEVALRNNRNYLGIEINSDYAFLSQQRLENVALENYEVILNAKSP